MVLYTKLPVVKTVLVRPMAIAIAIAGERFSFLGDSTKRKRSCPVSVRSSSL